MWKKTCWLSLLDDSTVEIEDRVQDPPAGSEQNTYLQDFDTDCGNLDEVQHIISEFSSPDIQAVDAGMPQTVPAENLESSDKEDSCSQRGDNSTDNDDLILPQVDLTEEPFDLEAEVDRAVSEWTQCEKDATEKTAKANATGKMKEIEADSDDEIEDIIKRNPRIFKSKNHVATVLKEALVANARKHESQENLRLKCSEWMNSELFRNSLWNSACDAGIVTCFSLEKQFLTEAAKSLLRFMVGTPQLLQGWASSRLVQALPVLLATALTEVQSDSPQALGYAAARKAREIYAEQNAQTHEGFSCCN